jgi:hypothetical protein
MENCLCPKSLPRDTPATLNPTFSSSTSLPDPCPAKSHWCNCRNCDVGRKMGLMVTQSQSVSKQMASDSALAKAAQRMTHMSPRKFMDSIPNSTLSEYARSYRHNCSMTCWGFCMIVATLHCPVDRPLLFQADTNVGGRAPSQRVPQCHSVDRL